MDSLPLELLRPIFIFAYPEVDALHGDHSDSLASTWTLTSVSRLWRMVAIDAKSLWTKILIEHTWPEDSSSEEDLRFVRSVMHRISLVLARSNPLSFSVRTSIIYETDDRDVRMDFDILLCAIFANAHRLGSFFEEADSYASCSFTRSLIPLPQLRTLQLRYYDFEDPPQESTGTTIHAPLLRDLRIRHFDAADHTAGGEESANALGHFLLSLGLPWNQITNLTVDFGPGFRHSYLLDLLSMVSTFPGLQLFSLRVETEDMAFKDLWETPTGVRCLMSGPKDLKTLRLRGAHTAIGTALSIVPAPRLRCLQFDLLDGPHWPETSDESVETADTEVLDPAWNWGPEFLNHIDTFLDTLHNKSSVVQLVLHGFNDLPVLEIVNQLPNLQSLSVDWLDMDLVRYMTMSASRQPSLLLEALTWTFDPDTTQADNRRILKMLSSRADTPLCRIHVLYEPNDENSFRNALLPKLSKWRTEARQKCFVASTSLKVLDWKPLQLYEQPDEANFF